MNTETIQELILQGENSVIEFKSLNVRNESLAKEMVAFSNTLGGMILIGVEDDGIICDIPSDQKGDLERRVANIARNNLVPAIDPDILFHSISGQTICSVEVPKGEFKPYQTLEGKFLIRIGSTNRNASKEELSRLFQQAGLIHFDIAPITGSTMDDLDEKKLHDYWATHYEIDYLNLSNDEKQQILVNSDIITKTGECSVGGLLIFGRYPQKKLPQSGVNFAVFKGVDLTDELVDKKNVVGTLPEMIESLVNLITLYLPRASTINGIFREEKELLPKKIIREALVNALAHRDYSLSNQKISVYIFNNRVEISSPGRLPNTLTIEKIRVGNSAPRNIFLIRFLDNMRYIDGLGRGVPLIIKNMSQRVTFEEIGEIFRVVLYVA